MNYLTKPQIVTINRLTTTIHGGNFVEPSNFLNENAIDYLIDAVQSELFGAPLYPTISEKAGVYVFNIIANHVFTDGNKRTGLEAGLIFMKLNGYCLSPSVTDQRLTEFILSVASGDQKLEDVQEWIKNNSVLI